MHDCRHKHTNKVILCVISQITFEKNQKHRQYTRHAAQLASISDSMQWVAREMRAGSIKPTVLVFSWEVWGLEDGMGSCDGILIVRLGKHLDFASLYDCTI